MTVSDAPEMIPAERRARIVEALEEQRVVKVVHAQRSSRRLRDHHPPRPQAPRARGRARRTHGGAVLKGAPPTTRPSRAPQPQHGAGEGAHRQGRRRHDRAARHRVPRLGHDGGAPPALRRPGPRGPRRHAQPGGRRRDAGPAASRSSSSAASTGPQLNAVEGTWPLDMIGSSTPTRRSSGADGLDSEAGLTTAEHRGGRHRARHDPPHARRGRRAGRQQQDRARLPGGHLPSRPDRRGAGRRRASRAEVRNKIQRAGPRCEAV